MSADGSPTAFRLAGPDIVGETFEDGEAVVVNLDNGFYFSLNAVGGLVLAGLASGTPLAEVSASLEKRHVAEPGVIDDAVRDFAIRLVEEGLLAPADAPLLRTNGQLARHDGLLGMEWPEVNGERTPFEAPTVFAYTDMQDLLLADPIHDYDETGWPARVDDR
jgi:hypothetical protein